MANVAASRPGLAQAAESSRFLISDLCSLLESYLSPEEVREIYRAYLFGAEAHEGQTRLTGEPYIYHPLAVARTMAEMRLDAQSIMAAILHDVIEDTETAKSQIEAEFGTEVAELVDGVSKLSSLSFESKAEAAAESFRKMMLAVARDLRVIMIKLADRLHNMRTLGVMRPEKRRRIARETLDIYAPIAQRLGMNQLRNELEDLGFRALYPMRHRVLEAAVQHATGHHRELMQKVEAGICARLEELHIEARILGRTKNLYSIYRKMRAKRLSFKEVFDVFAVRIIAPDVDTCYRILGAVHNLYTPVPGRFKDYIAIPKANGYQSLHTTLFGPNGIPIEVQIRTEEMDRVAEVGIAAHWLYKAGQGGAPVHDPARRWLEDVLEIQRRAGNSLEFLESIKVDLFPDEVYVFTPAGEIRALPRGATAVDFAYAIHSDVGNTCVAVKIDRRLAPLSTVLQSGQTVEVITASTGRPNPNWLDFVVTGKARAAIRHYLKNQKREEARRLGRRLLEKALAGFDLSLREVSVARMATLLEELGLESLDDLLEEIGLGKRMAQVVAHRLAPARVDEDDTEPAVALSIEGTEGMVVSFAKCCYPIPGDPVVGVLSAGRGLVVHRDHCSNVRAYRRMEDRTLSVRWAEAPQGEFLTAIRVQTRNERGVLAEMAARISGQHSNIENITFERHDGSSTTLTFVLAARDRRHLARILRALRKVPQVYSVKRVG
ncbi:MAG TPA: bifunctional (p)ppGpp synthetase/guanosine-3',5'-bis(diphosphate) 3'-pyrophosphohydrolase [Chromatiales bacterium]|nr:bifunctional (p)ppGpp synthetase/guanosine-3',5'-bis(diphosphate) 3'-pyrophosphohydrolase [Chromatiales bacterium]